MGYFLFTTGVRCKSLMGWGGKIPSSYNVKKCSEEMCNKNKIFNFRNSRKQELSAHDGGYFSFKQKWNLHKLYVHYTVDVL